MDFQAKKRPISDAHLCAQNKQKHFLKKINVSTRRSEKNQDYGSNLSKIEFEKKIRKMMNSPENSEKIYFFQLKKTVRSAPKCLKIFQFVFTTIAPICHRRWRMKKKIFMKIFVKIWANFFTHPKFRPTTCWRSKNFRILLLIFDEKSATFYKQSMFLISNQLLYRDDFDIKQIFKKLL